MSDTSTLVALPARRFARWIPSLEWLRVYDKNWLRGDLPAGLTAASVVVPQAMAYAAIAGLPLVVGLYTGLVPLVVYAVMGTSRPLSVTTTSTIAILTGDALHEAAFSGGNKDLLTATVTLAFLVGLTLLVSSVLRLGALASLISDPVLIGFKAGVGLTIVIAQIPKLLGVHFPSGSFFHNLASIFSHIPQASAPTIILGVAMLAILIGLEQFVPRVPASLVTVAVGIIVSVALGLEHHGIELVGNVKGGLPSITLSNPSMFRSLWPAALGIALISFVETIAAGQAFRAANEPLPDPNKELCAIALCNLVGSLFQNMPSGGGTSQTAVNRTAGARTQVAGLVTSGVVAAVLLFLAPVVRLMPQATLAAVVIVPCAMMIRLQAFAAVYRFRMMEFSWAIASFIGVVLLGTLRGIIVAVLLSLLALIYHSNRWPVVVLARKPGTDVFRPVSQKHPEDESFPGLLMLRTEGMVHFANVRRIFDQIWTFVNQYKPRILLFDCSAISDFEYSALQILIEADKKLQQAGITLWLAALNPEPLEMIKESDLGKALGPTRLFFNLEYAVEAFKAQSPQR